MDLLGPAVVGAAGAFAAFKTAKGVASVFSSVSTRAKALRDDLVKVRDGFTKAREAASSAVGPVKRFFKPGGGSDTLRLRAMQAGDAVKRAAGFIRTGASTLAGYAKTGASAAVSVAKTTAAWIAQKAALVASKVATLAMTAAQKAATVAQWAFNTAMSANPIMLIVLAIGALVAGLVLAYKKVGWFRAAVDAAFRGIKTVVGAVVGFIREHWQLLLAIITGPIGMAVLVVTKHWDKIKGGAAAIVGWVRDHWKGLLALITGPIGLAVLAVTTHWDTIKNGFRTVRDFIRGRVSDIAGFITGLPGRLRSIADRLKSALLAPFKAAFRAIAKLWNSTVGKLSFKVPSWVPKLGGKGWNVPNIDTSAFDKYHSGGRLRRIPGRTGTEVPFVGLAGERVLSIPQTRAWESAMSRRGGDGSGGWGGWVFEGPVTFGDNARRTVRDLQLFSMAQGREVARS
jgi:hypothetical protein